MSNIASLELGAFGCRHGSGRFDNPVRFTAFRERKLFLRARLLKER
ncbi:MAG: hypothetical protein P8M65_09035 [Roseibacillus sp.]|nr:hypothetical protein [Roseibacillus sp.]